MDFKNWGEFDSYWNTLPQHQKNRMPGMYDKMYNSYNTQGGFEKEGKGMLGSNFGYLEGLIKERIGGKNPLFDQIFGNAQRRIGAVTDRNVRGIKEQNAQSGFRGTGANQINDAYRNEGNAMSQVNDSLMQAQLGQQQSAINQLLGLNQQESGMNWNMFQSNRNQSNFNRQQNFAEDQAKTDFGDVLGGILGMGAGALGGGFLGGLGSKWAG